MTREPLRDFIASRCIERGTMPGKRPGTLYAWMFYLRRALFDADALRSICALMLADMTAAHPRPFQIAGTETAAAPLLAGLTLEAHAQGWHLPAFIVRRERKHYGRENWIEGTPDKDRPVVLVDDLCNSGATLLHAHNRILCEGLRPALLASVIVNKYASAVHDAERATSDLYLPRGYRVRSLFTLDDFGLSNPSH